MQARTLIPCFVIPKCLIHCVIGTLGGIWQQLLHLQLPMSSKCSLTPIALTKMPQIWQVLQSPLSAMSVHRTQHSKPALEGTLLDYLDENWETMTFLESWTLTTQDACINA